MMKESDDPDGCWLPGLRKPGRSGQLRRRLTTGPSSRQLTNHTFCIE